MTLSKQTAATDGFIYKFAVSTGSQDWGFVTSAAEADDDAAATDDALDIAQMHFGLNAEIALVSKVAA